MNGWWMLMGFVDACLINNRVSWSTNVFTILVQAQSLAIHSVNPLHWHQVSGNVCHVDFRKIRQDEAVVLTHITHLIVPIFCVTFFSKMCGVRKAAVAFAKNPGRSSKNISIIPSGSLTSRVSHIKLYKCPLFVELPILSTPPISNSSSCNVETKKHRRGESWRTNMAVCILLWQGLVPQAF